MKANEGGVIFIKVFPSSGKPMDLPRELVKRFKFEDRSVGVDKLTFEVDNSDLFFFEDPMLLVGNKLEFSFGYPSQLSFKRVATISAIRGFLALTIEAYSQESNFHMERMVKTYKEQSLDDVIASIARDMGYVKQDIKASSVKRAVVQLSRETYAQFLSRWGANLGCEWYVGIDNTFHFHPRDHAQQPIRTFTWKGARDRTEIVMTPEIEHEVKNKPGSFESVAVDPKGKKVKKHTANKDTAPPHPVLGGFTLVQEDRPWSNKPAKALTLTTWHNEQYQAENLGAKYRVVQQSQMKLKLPVVGDPSLTAKSVVRLENFGTLISGNYYVVSATHRIGNGFFTDLELRRDAIGKPRVAKKEADKSSVGASARENQEKTPKEKKSRESFLPK